MDVKRRELDGGVLQLATDVKGEVELDVFAPRRPPVRFPLLLEVGERIELGDVALARGGGGVRFVVDQPAGRRVVRFSVTYRDPGTGGEYQRVLEVTAADEAVLDGVSSGALALIARDFELDLRIAGSDHPLLHAVAPLRVEAQSHEGRLTPVHLDIRFSQLPR